MEKEQIIAIAAEATKKYLETFGDKYPCGFAWIDIIPKHKGNTVLGKVERAELREMGFELDYTGKKFSFWNPSKNSTQSMDAKYEGAMKAAFALQNLGYNANAHWRMD